MIITTYYKLAELAASRFFDAEIRHHIGYKGFDLLCKNGQKIDVKSSMLYRRSSGGSKYWQFAIMRNKKTDYFFCVGFDIIGGKMVPLHIWLFKGKEKVRERKINDRKGLYIKNMPKKLRVYRPFELVDRLQEFKAICDSITIISVDSNVTDFPDK